MSLLDTASLILTPNGYKATNLYSVKPTDASGDMVVSRATTATRVNSSGLIESVAINVPRLDYTGGGCPSILVEPQRTNLVFPSATLTTQTRTVTAVANTLSFYGTGTIVLAGAHIATLTGTGANNRVSLTFTPTAGSLILTVTGTVTNAQLEAGSNATSYIPTVTGTVSRNADVISKTGVSSLIGQTEGTIFVEANLTANTNERRIITVSNGTETQRIMFWTLATTLYANFNGVGVSLGSFPIGTAKIALGYTIAGGSTTYSIYVNNNTLITNTAAAAPNPLSAINLGSSSTGILILNDRIESATLFPTRLTDPQLATLTAI